MLYDRVRFKETWADRERRIGVFSPCNGNCLVCRYYKIHKEELNSLERIYIAIHPANVTQGK